MAPGGTLLGDSLGDPPFVKDLKKVDTIGECDFVKNAYEGVDIINEKDWILFFIRQSALKIL